jgi:hypothetical protein
MDTSVSWRTPKGRTAACDLALFWVAVPQTQAACRRTRSDDEVRSEAIFGHRPMFCRSLALSIPSTS